MNIYWLSGFALVALLSGCGHHDHSDHAHSGHEHHADQEPELPTEKITHYTEHSELFVEFPRLLVGQPSVFAAHISQLPSFEALTEGRVSVILAANQQTDQRFETDRPTQAGIFRPEVTPVQAGLYTLTIEIQQKTGISRHELGQVRVYADRTEALADTSPEMPTGIFFSKEQQWKTDFATTEVSEGQLSDSLSVFGTLAANPNHEAQLSAVATGQLNLVNGRWSVGQWVEAGTLLAYVQPQLSGDRDLASLQSAFKKATAQWELAQKAAVRTEKLYQEGVTSQKAWQDAQANLRFAEAEREATTQRLKQLGQGSTGIPIVAPLSGQLLSVPPSTGAYVNAGDVLFHLVDSRQTWLRLSVPESQVSQINALTGLALNLPNHPVIELPLNDKTRVIQRFSAVDPQTRMATLLIASEALPQGLPLGLAIKAELWHGQARKQRMIPAASLIEEGGLYRVYRQLDAEQFEVVWVKVGRRQGHWVEILDGLALGDRVVSTGAYWVKLASLSNQSIGHGHAH